MLMRTTKKIMAIKSAAKEIFLSQGFNGANMHDIAILANVSKRTLYHHFPEKTYLFQQVIQDHWQAMLNLSQVKPKKNEQSDTFLKRFAHGVLTFLYRTESLAFFRVLIAESERFPNLAESLLKEGKAPFTQTLINYLIQQNKSHALEIEDVMLAASQFMGLIKEDQFWSRLLGFHDSINTQNTTLLINSAVKMFTGYYKKNIEK